MTVTLKEFFAEWAGPCAEQKSITDSLAAKYESVEFKRINVDEQQEIANEYQVRSLPTIVVESNGEVIDRYVNVTKEVSLEDSLETALAEANMDTGGSKQGSDNTDSSETIVFEDTDSSSSRETKIYEPSESDNNSP